MVNTQRSTSQQSVMQDSDYMSNAYTVTQDSHNNQVQPKGCQKQTAPRFLLTSDQVGFYLASTHQMVPAEHRAHIRLNRPATHLSTSGGWKAELA